MEKGGGVEWGKYRLVAIVLECVYTRDTCRVW